MKLRTGTTLATLPQLSNVAGMTANRHFRLEYEVELMPLDVAADLTLVSATLVVANTFGGTELVLTKTVGAAYSPTAGQITANGSSGVASLYFILTPGNTALLVTPRAFEVVVVDSLGRETTLDAGSLVARPSASSSLTSGTGDVFQVSMTPERAAAIVTHGFVVTAEPQGADGTPLLGRTVTWDTSNVGVATVDASGNVSPVGTGSALITATCEGISGVCLVTVLKLTLGSGVRIGGVTP